MHTCLLTLLTFACTLLTYTQPNHPIHYNPSLSPSLFLSLFISLSISLFFILFRSHFLSFFLSYTLSYSLILSLSLFFRCSCVSQLGDVVGAQLDGCHDPGLLGTTGGHIHRYIHTYIHTYIEPYTPINTISLHTHINSLQLTLFPTISHHNISPVILSLPSTLSLPSHTADPRHGMPTTDSSLPTLLPRHPTISTRSCRYR